MKRVACVYVPHFVAEIERQRHETEMRPLLVAEGERVLGACARAAALGVVEGEPLSEALAHCPDACVIAAEPPRYQAAWAKLVELLGRHSPGVEAERWGLAYLDAAGMGRFYGDEEAWCEVARQQAWQEVRVKVQVGIAKSKFVALVAARSSQFGPGYRAVAGDDRAYLASFPVEWLPLDREPLRRLGLLGIHTIGQFAALSPAAVAEQLGGDSAGECLHAHRLARGRDDRPVRARPQQMLEAHVEFSVPEVRLEPLVGALARASERLLRDLKRGNLAVRRVELEARFADGEAAIESTWVGDLLAPRRLGALLQDLLARLKGDGLGVMEAWLRLVGLEPWVGRQLDLFAHAAGRERLEGALRALAHKHSPACVVRACLVDPHTPLGQGHRFALREVCP